MAIGSGLGSSCGFAPESVFGTYVAPTRFLKGSGFSVKKVLNTVEVGGLAAGQSAPTDEVVTTEGGTGQFSGQVMKSGWGLILQHLMGGNAIPVQQGATTAWLQTHAWSDNKGKSLTGQIGIPDTGGTARPYTGLGGKITSAEFSCQISEALTASVDLDYREITEAQTLAAPSYAVNKLPFHGRELTVSLGAFGAEASVTGVRGYTLKFERPQDLEAFYAGAAGKKAEPNWNDFAMISGTLEIDYVTKADFVDRFVGHSNTSMVIAHTGAVISGAFSELIRFRLPKVYFSGDIPSIDGPGVSKASVPFRAFLDSTNGLAFADYMSTDTTV